jgi:hypothetical protein
MPPVPFHLPPLYDTRTPCPFSAPMANLHLHHEFGSALKAESAPTGGGTHGGLEETNRFLRCVARTFRAKQKSPSWCETLRSVPAQQVRREGGRPVGTTVHGLQSLGEAGSVVRLKDPGLKSERNQKP